MVFCLVDIDVAVEVAWPVDSKYKEGSSSVASPPPFLLSFFFNNNISPTILIIPAIIK